MIDVDIPLNWLTFSLIQLLNLLAESTIKELTLPCHPDVIELVLVQRMPVVDLPLLVPTWAVHLLGPKLLVSNVPNLS